MTTVASPILSPSGEPFQREIHAVPSSRRFVRAGYEAAEDDNREKLHWSKADLLGPRTAHNPLVRAKLRSRSRHETSNNSFADCLLRTKSAYVVGEGPRVQVLTDSRDYNQLVEQLFHEWADYIEFADKLRLMIYAMDGDGESFGVFKQNLGASFTHPTRLDFEVAEAEVFSNPEYEHLNEERIDDGIVTDDYGNVIAYKRYRRHPGDFYPMGAEEQAEVVRAEHVVHLFHARRPGQMRGVPSITPALMLFPVLRRWTMATLYAAETAAKFAGIFKTDQPPPTHDDGSHMDAYEAFDELHIEANTFMTLPHNVDAMQFRAEHPATTFPMLRREILTEIARCVVMPYNVAVGDSSAHNFASGKLDHLPFRRDNACRQKMASRRACEKAFDHFMAFGELAGMLPPSPVGGPPRRKWLWPSDEPIDPREAGANLVKLQSGQATPTSLHAENGQDFEETVAAGAADLGITADEYRELIKNQIFTAPMAADAGAEGGGAEDDTEQGGNDGSA